MQAVSADKTDSVTELSHELQPYFSELAKFESTAEMERSALYKRLKPQVERVLNRVVQENLAANLPSDSTNLTAVKSRAVRAAAWNIERGIQLGGILAAFQNHSALRELDLYLITELDDGMARSGNENVPRRIAAAARLNYVFAAKYIALNKGSGVEAFVPGENTKALHGVGIFSKFPIRNAHSIPIPSGKDKMRGKEKRLGGTRALVAEIEHAAGTFRAAVVHLDAHSSRKHRVLQMKTLLDHLATLPAMPTLIGGDWNTTTHNSQSAKRAIMGYWRRVLMGAKNVAQNHYPFPEKYFERELFELIEARGFDYKTLNEIGTGSLHYDAGSLEKNVNLGDWVPAWCFPFIRAAMSRVGNRISLKLDWLAGKNIKLAPNTKPRVINDLIDETGAPLSDHDAIVVDFVLN